MPFRSEAQRRKFHVLASEGKMSKAEVHKWEHETKNKKSLPYHVAKAKKASSKAHRRSQA